MSGFLKMVSQVESAVGDNCLSTTFGGTESGLYFCDPYADAESCFTPRKAPSSPMALIEQHEIRIKANAALVDHQQRIRTQTDRLFAWIMIVQWYAGIIIALWVSPQSATTNPSYFNF